MNIADIGLKIDVKVELKHPIEGKQFIELNGVTENDGHGDLFKGLSDVISNFLNKQHLEIVSTGPKNRYLNFTDCIEVPDPEYVDKEGNKKQSFLIRTPKGDRYAAPKYDIEELKTKVAYGQFPHLDK